MKKTQVVYSTLILVVLAMGLVAATNHYGGSPFTGTTGYNPSFGGSGFYGGNSYQAYQPSFTQLYRGGSNIGLSQIWPILNDLENDQCHAATDFVVGISPAGCQPLVVRSDLLAEQPVPVFCELYAIKVNPLIKTSAIKHISFKGKHPEGVAGISFHPARAAVRSYGTLLGDPLINNIGYVVIILDQQRNESAIIEEIAGNLTATIHYDADLAYGTGRAEYYVPVLNEQEWQTESSRYSFWQGRGHVRVTGIDRNTATIQVLGDENHVLQTFVLQEGQTSGLTYMPGYYCRAGLRVRLNRLETPEDSALINIDGNDLWVRQGSKMLNDACSVTRIDIDGKETSFFGSTREENYTAQQDPTGSVRISCPGSTFELSINKREELRTRQAPVHNKSITLTDAALSSTRKQNFVGANQTTRNLVALYPTEDKGGNLGTYGEEALFEQILLAERTGQQATSAALMKLFLDTYGSSHLVGDLLVRQERLGKFDYANALETVYVNGRYHTFGLHQLHDSGTDNKTVQLGILGQGRTGDLREGDFINLSGDGSEYLQVRSIEPSKVSITYRNTDRNARQRSGSVTIFEGERGVVGPDVDISVERINAEELAYISLVPEVKHTRTEANFTFRIGVEKRGIQLSPEKTREMIANVEDSIDKFENINDKLGTVIKGWKGACFATSALLTMKSMATSFDGTALARQKVMQRYKAICDREYGPENRDLCYSEKADEIEANVTQMKEALNRVNTKMQSAQEGVTSEGGLFGEDSITDQTKYLEQLKSQVADDWSMVIDGQRITKADLQTTSQIRAALLETEFSGSSGPAAEAATNEIQGTLRNLAITTAQRQRSEATSQQIKDQWGVEVPGNKIAVLPGEKPAVTLRWGGEFAQAYNLPAINGSDPKTTRVQAMELPGRPEVPVLAVLSTPAGTGSTQTMSIRQLYVREGTTWQQVTNAKELGVDTGRITFSGAGIGQNGKCSNPWPTGTARVVYYESGENRGLPAIVPFDTTNGWYVMVPNSGGSFIEDTPKGYQASGDVSYLKICNIGQDGVMSSGTGDDICQSFSANTADQVKSFGSCPGLAPEEVTRMYNNAREAVRQASAQSGSSTVTVLGQRMSLGDPRSSIGGFECQDFMSVEDCKIMFNACDPVICPSSRCDLGGKYPVQDVVQTGIIGSIALCLPNAAEGIYVPICLTGIHAGLDAYISVLKSEQQCLQHSLDTGQYIGICDEITSVYKCEFFWRQLSPLINIALPKFVEGLVGTNEGVRGGGEYLLVQSAFDNLDRSVNFFKNTYAQNTFRAFELRNTQEAGSTFCKAFIGSSFPTSASALDSLLEPESPHQFYAEFDEFPFTDATVPATSQYKVFYHIFAGNEIGTQYRIYLKNPPASSFYQSTPVIHVKTGFVARGSQATESVDFTAPAGYKELCVAIGTQEDCGFRKVTTNFAVNYLESKYVEEQATAEDITTEKECISGTPSVYPLANLNIQAGVQEATQPDISLRGIVRVCATGNPGQNLDNGIQRWKDVGHCGDPNLRCWVDLDSVQEDLQRVTAVEGVTLSAAERQVDYLQTTKKSFEDAEKILSRIRQEVRALDADQSEAFNMIIELDNLVGDVDNPGVGSNNQKAEALALKATIYRYLVDQDINAGVTIQTGPRQAVVETSPQTSVTAETVEYWSQIRQGDVLFDQEYDSNYIVSEVKPFPSSDLLLILLDKVGGGQQESFEVESNKPLREMDYTFVRRANSASPTVETSDIDIPPLLSQIEGFTPIANEDGQVKEWGELGIGFVLGDKESVRFFYVKDIRPVIGEEEIEYVLEDIISREERIEVHKPSKNFDGILWFDSYYHWGYYDTGRIIPLEEETTTTWDEEITGTYAKASSEIVLANGQRAKLSPDKRQVFVALVYYVLTFVDEGTGEEYQYLLPATFSAEDGQEYTLRRLSSPQDDVFPKSEKRTFASNSEERINVWAMVYKGKGYYFLHEGAGDGNPNDDSWYIYSEEFDEWVQTADEAYPQEIYDLVWDELTRHADYNQGISDLRKLDSNAKRL